MKASYRWLRELLPSLDPALTPIDVAARLTSGGLEVEGITEFGAGAEACLLVAVVAINPHPTKSGLRLVTVDRGGATQVVVCGAPNVPDPGGLVVLAPLGTVLPAKGMTIEPRAIGGVMSEGMLCSESELGLSEEGGGIITLPPNPALVGKRFTDVFPNARDTVYEVNVTPNRPDALGHVGIARDLATLTGAALVVPAATIDAVADVETKSLATITVADAERCPHYGAAGAIDVTIGPSPLDVRYRLHALGIRAISNVVDVTNLVMLEFGHPMHAFDLDRVGKATIDVRRAKDGEAIKTLDGVDRKLVADDLLICDGDGPVALAGVMGGASSEIQGDTKRVLFECAYFDPRGVRRTARRNGMHTESSHRFERGVDPGDVAAVLDRAVALTTKLAGAKATKGRVHVQGAHVASEPTPPERKSIALRPHRIRDILGIEIPLAEVRTILERLGCEVSKGDSPLVVVPSHRPDISREIDLIEEIIRIHGIDRVPAVLPAIRASRDVGGYEELLRRAREVCTAIGLAEAITFSFTAEKSLSALSAPEPTVRLAKPLTELQTVMRTTLLVGLCDAVRNARRHGERDVREFTLGAVFLPANDKTGGLPEERPRLAVILAGDRPGWLEKPKPVDVFDLTGYASEIVRRLSGRDARIVPVAKADAPAHLHPRGAAFLEVARDGGAFERVGSLGPLHPDAVEALELDGEAFVLEIDLAPFAGGPAKPSFAAIPRFPASTRDAAFIVKDGVPAGDVRQAVREAAGPLAEDVRLFDRFVGGQIPAGSASLAFRVVYRSVERTLTEAEVDAAHASAVKAVNDRFGATLRG